MTNIADKRQYYYHIWGLTIASELEMPVFSARAIFAQPADNAIDVCIALGEVPKQLESPQDQRVLYMAKPNEFLMWLPFASIWVYVTNGNRITIEADITAHNTTDGELLQMLLMGGAFGALFFQRQLMPLHASAIAINGKAVLFAGLSGTGKSTLAAALQQAGHALLSDNISVIRKNADHQVFAEAGEPFFKLWKDSFKLLDQEVPQQGRVRAAIEKYILPAENIVTSALPIHRIFIIQKSKAAKKPQIQALSSIDGIHQLRMVTFRYNYLIGLGGEPTHFQTAFQLGRLGIVQQLTVPMNYPLDELVAFVRNNESV